MYLRDDIDRKFGRGRCGWWRHFLLIRRFLTVMFVDPLLYWSLFGWTWTTGIAGIQCNLIIFIIIIIWWLFLIPSLIISISQYRVIFYVCNKIKSTKIKPTSIPFKLVVSWHFCRWRLHWWWWCWLPWLTLHCMDPHALGWHELAWTIFTLERIIFIVKHIIIQLVEIIKDIIVLVTRRSRRSRTEAGWCYSFTATAALIGGWDRTAVFLCHSCSWRGCWRLRVQCVIAVLHRSWGCARFLILGCDFIIASKILTISRSSWVIAGGWKACKFINALIEGWN